MTPFSRFLALVERLSTIPIYETLFLMHSSPGGASSERVMTPTNLLQFLQQEQGEATATIEFATDLCRRFHTDKCVVLRYNEQAALRLTGMTLSNSRCANSSRFSAHRMSMALAIPRIRKT